MKWICAYTTEMFIFMQLLGWTHASWWWMVWFLLADASTYTVFKKLDTQEVK